MQKREFGPVGAIELQKLFDDAWTEFKATSPAGILLMAEASLRSMIATRLMRATERGRPILTPLKLSRCTVCEM
jgi:hypothetical protein